MLIEADVVRAAGAAGVPVPELLAAERQPDGAAFMVLEAIDGETIARKILRDDDYRTRARRTSSPTWAGPWRASTPSIRRR